MQDSGDKSKILKLLEKTAEAHHEYEESDLGGKKDENWPEWYAKYLMKNGLNDLFEEELTAPDIADTLLEAARKFENDPGDLSWGEVYTEFLLFQFT